VEDDIRIQSQRSSVHFAGALIQCSMTWFLLSTHRTSSLYEINKITKEGSSEIFSTDEEGLLLSLWVWSGYSVIFLYLPSLQHSRHGMKCQHCHLSACLGECFDRDVTGRVHQQAIHVRVAGLLLHRLLFFLLWQQI
jgi:hypothetical protein